MCRDIPGYRLQYRGNTLAFSLVEVVIAISVFAFCLLILIALIPVGLTGNKTSRDRTIVADLCSSIESDLRTTPIGSYASPLYNIKFPTPAAAVSVSSTNVLYDSYNVASPTATFGTTLTASSQYSFTVVLTSSPTESNPNAPVIANILATWPAQASVTNAVGKLNVSVAINRF